MYASVYVFIAMYIYIYMLHRYNIYIIYICSRYEYVIYNDTIWTWCTVDMAGHFPNGWSLQGELSSQAEPLRPWGLSAIWGWTCLRTGKRQVFLWQTCWVKFRKSHLLKFRKSYGSYGRFKLTWLQVGFWTAKKKGKNCLKHPSALSTSSVSRLHRSTSSELSFTPTVLCRRLSLPFHPLMDQNPTFPPKQMEKNTNIWGFP